MTTRVAVVGGGISGLTAAYRLRQYLGADATIIVCEARPELGGKIRTERLADVGFDMGAEAFLARRPEAVALARELGFGEQLTHPAPYGATVRAGGRTLPLPKRTFLGVPAEPGAVRDVLSPEGYALVEREAMRPGLALPEGDVSLGGLLRERFGDELVDRIVDPLLGGVYAGGADGLGLRATMPALAAAVDSGATSLTEAAAALLPSGDGTPAPVFATLTGGLGGITECLFRASRAETRLGTPVRALARGGAGWRLTFGAAAASHAPEQAVMDVDAVVLAVPAPAASRLLADVVSEAATALSEVELASMAVVGLAYRAGVELPESSGCLIAEGERHADGTPFTAKAFTFSARKWGHHDGGAGGPVLLRGSVGRFGDAGALRPRDDELVRLVRADLAELSGITAEPVATLVTRWGGGLPQYGTGHLERIARAEAAVAEVPGLALAGAALHGVGIPACIATAEAAARRIVGN